jgi:hypothetical protein
LVVTIDVPERSHERGGKCVKCICDITLFGERLALPGEIDGGGEIELSKS